LVLFHPRSGARLKIGATVLARLAEHAQASADALEAGGVLIGRRIDETLDTVVDCVSRPVAADRRTRQSFHRSARAHQRIVDAAWRRSDGTAGYVGEWHTHPEPCPKPSPVDLRDWSRRLREDSVDAPDVYFVIVGTLDVLAWRGDRRLGTIDDLVIAPCIDFESGRAS
jgi:integrative and conjugative element protein (TIGR02256 family)